MQILRPTPDLLMQNFLQVRVPGGSDVKASDAKGVYKCPSSLTLEQVNS